MGVKLVSTISICFSIVIAIQLSRAANCTDRCGNITIESPFGIGEGCYMEKAFEIYCNKTTNGNRVVFLASIRREVQVLNISVTERGSITVKGPIIFSNCPDRNIINNIQPVNLTGTPFSLSDFNVLTAVGCNSRVSTTGSNGELVGCDSTCEGARDASQKERRLSYCNGYNCCRASISSLSQPQAINLSLEAKDGKDTCKLAFVADSAGLLNETTDTIQYRDYVPLRLNWRMSPSRWKYNSRTMQCTNVHYDGNVTVGGANANATATATATECRCGYGYEGNAYLSCIDIDECKKGEHTCRGITRCVNTPGSFKCDTDPKWIIIIVLGGVIGLLALLFGVWKMYKLILKKREIELKKKNFKRNGGLLLQQQISSNDGSVQRTKIFSSNELAKATDRFSVDRILGEGGQGTVYKGMLPDGSTVAVKKSKLVDEEKLQEFINEVVILSQINHRNVVRLHGCCLETEVPLLVYEFIPNGSLFGYLHAQNEEVPLSWDMRLKIATEVAGALAYLHSAASVPVYHRDIKSTNILLGEKFIAKVSDFGTSRSIAVDQTHLTTHVQGTFGYLDPEYFQSSQFTDKSDVYSFGVVLVELLSGQKPICWGRPEENRSLATYFKILMEENRVFEIIDDRIKECGHEKEIIAVANIAKQCLNLNGRKRPTMKEVAIQLEGIRSSGSNLKVQQITEQNEDTQPLMMWDTISTSVTYEFDDSFKTSASIDVEPLIP